MLAAKGFLAQAVLTVEQMGFIITVGLGSRNTQEEVAALLI